LQNKIYDSNAMFKSPFLFSSISLIRNVVWRIANKVARQPWGQICLTQRIFRLPLVRENYSELLFEPKPKTSGWFRYHPVSEFFEAACCKNSFILAL